MEDGATSSSDSAKGRYSTRDVLGLRAKIQSSVSNVFKAKFEDSKSMMSTNLLPGICISINFNCICITLNIIF